MASLMPESALSTLKDEFPEPDEARARVCRRHVLVTFQLGVLAGVGKVRIRTSRVTTDTTAEELVVACTRVLDAHRQPFTFRFPSTLTA